MTSPLVHNGKVYIASVDENLKGEGHVYALAGEDGEILWSYPVRNSIKNTIAIDKGVVFAQDAHARLRARRPDGGLRVRRIARFGQLGTKQAILRTNQTAKRT